MVSPSTTHDATRHVRSQHGEPVKGPQDGRSLRRRTMPVRTLASVGALVMMSGAVAACGQDTAASKSTKSTTTDAPTSTAAASTTATTATPAATDPTTTTPPSTESTTAVTTTEAPTTVATTSAATPEDILVASGYSGWDTRRKLALLMFPGLNTGGGDNQGSSTTGDVQPMIEEGIGGFFIGRKELNLFNSSTIQAASSPSGAYPLLVATDAEGGRVDPLPQVSDPMPPAVEVANLDNATIEAMAKKHAEELRAHGVNVNFGPILDLTSDTLPLGNRTFSRDRNVVIEKAGAFARGMCAGGVYPTFKHYPGHGKSDYDADVRVATTPSVDVIRGDDLIPFTTLTQAMPNQSMVMTGHLDVPGLTTGMPFSLDALAMKMLRDESKFQGIAVTDELAEMRSITDRGIGVGEAVERSLIAGNDMALFFGDSGSLNSVLDRLEGAVAEGRLSMDRVDESARRVLTMKANKGCPGS